MYSILTVVTAGIIIGIITTVGVGAEVRTTGIIIRRLIGNQIISL